MGLTEFLTNLTEIVTALITMFTSVMTVFMEPPLSLFIGVGLITLIYLLITKLIQRHNMQVYNKHIQEYVNKRDKRIKDDWEFYKRNKR